MLMRKVPLQLTTKKTTTEPTLIRKRKLDQSKSSWTNSSTPSIPPLRPRAVVRRIAPTCSVQALAGSQTHAVVPFDASPLAVKDLESRRRQDRDKHLSRVRASARKQKEVVSSVLLHNAVNHPTRVLYTRLIRELGQWLRTQMPTSTLDQLVQTPIVLDDLLVDYFDHLFLDCEAAVSRGIQIMAALADRFPQYQGASRVGRLPCASRALQGWRKLHPNGMRMPWPFPAVAGVIMEMCRRGFLNMARLTMLTVDTYIRPGGILGLRGSSLISPQPRPGRSYRHYAVLAHPLGARSGFESGPVRREHHVGFAESVVDEPARSQVAGDKEQSRVSGGLLLPRVGDGLAELLPDLGSPRCDVVCASAHGRQRRQAAPKSVAARDQTTWQVGQRDKCEKVREECKDDGRHRTLAAPSSSASASLRESLEPSPAWKKGSHPAAYQPSKSRALKGPPSRGVALRQALCRKEVVFKYLRTLVFVEVFAGTGRLSQAFARLGYQVHSWDLLYGNAYDLLQPANLRRHRILLGTASAVHFAPPVLDVQCGISAKELEVSSTTLGHRQLE